MLVRRTVTAALSALTLTIVAAALVALPGEAAQLPQKPAEPLENGITVTATAGAVVTADTVRLEFRARTRARTIHQALADFRAKRSLLDKVLADFVDVGLEVESGGVTVGLKQSDTNSFMMDDTPAAPPFEAAEVVTLRFPATEAGLDTIVELISAASEVDCELNDETANPYVMIYAGMNGGDGPPPPVAFEASQEALVAARDRAMALAYGDAKRQAESLAKIASRRIVSTEAIRIDKPFPAVVDTSGSAVREVTLTVRFVIG